MNQAGQFPVGVVIFDESSQPMTSAGYAVSQRGARRISRVTDLESDTIWWTSVSYAVFRKERIWQHPNMRNDQLFRIPMQSVIHELGLAHSSHQEQAEALFSVAQQALAFLAKNYGYQGAGFARLDWFLSQLLLKPGRRLSGPLAPLLTAARNAHEYVTASMAGGSQDAIARTYVAPRTNYLDSLLDLQVPAPQARWEFVKVGGVVDGDRLMEIGGKGALVELSVADLDADLGMVAPFAARQTISSEPRLWAPLPEAIFYANQSRTEIRGIWVCDEACQLRDIVAKPAPRSDFSFSAALVAENYLYALLGTTRGEAMSNGREPIAAYVAAYDRLMMIQQARRVYDLGYTPMSSACGGRLVVSVPAAAIQDLDEICTNLGFEPPVTG
ncbi:TPA: hypothetical protein ACF3PO_004630 [Pseudomonas aeruginosa]